MPSAPHSPLSEQAAEQHPILWDAGVLGSGPVCELGGWAGAGAQVVLTQRAQALAARDAGAEVLEADPPPGTFAQAVVHLQKSREASMRDVAAAAACLQPQGELLVIGYNELGIRSFGKQLDRLLGTPGRVRSNRRKGRVLGYARAKLAPPAAPAGQSFSIAEPVDMTLTAEPGVFSAGRLDPGSALLLAHLPKLAAPSRVVDLGCGAGTLGLQALAHFDRSRAVMLDADLRAVRTTRENAARLGLEARAAVHWWDAQEPLPELGPYDLALINPPFHTGKAVDMGPAFAMFEHAAAALRPGGQALIVANRTLPYEPALQQLGTLETLEQARGFKLLLLRRR